MTKELIMLDAKSLSEMDVERLTDFMGNPDLNSYKNKPEDSDYANFFLHPWVVKSILNSCVTKKDSINVLELGAGNGSNGRTLCKLLNTGKSFHLIHLDFYDQNLLEASRRNKEFSKLHPNFSFQCIQADLKSPRTRTKLISSLNNSIDVVFSIKFLHNTPMKVTREIARFLSSVTTFDGIFILQCYGMRSWEKEIINGLKRIRGHGYSNSVCFDRILARRFLKSVGFELIYQTKNKACKEKSFSHHENARYDYYFEKMR
jgi:hypothetical protein